MKRKILMTVSVALFGLLMVSPVVFANPVTVGVAEVAVNPGDYTNLSNPQITALTGYYVLDVYSDPGQTLLYDNLNSFCVDPAYSPTGISYTYNMDALPSNDTRYNQAAWLFTQVGTYTPTDIQRAIWQVMGLGPTVYNSNLVDLARNYTGFDTSGFVLFSSPRTGTTYGEEYQDYISRVPEPTTMLLFGLGLLGIAGIRRKFKG
jgi:hypothetical protein